MMNNYERIAIESGYKTWDEFVEDAKSEAKEFKVPPYMFYGKYGHNFCNIELLTKIKEMNFKLNENDSKMFLTRDKQEDIITPIETTGE